jgi:hypothetical protein
MGADGGWKYLSAALFEDHHASVAAGESITRMCGPR